MLLARMNKEYVDEDELAKKIVFDRTLRFVNNLYGDEPEVSLQQDQLTPTMQYSYDTLFEDFKGAINQVLESEDPEKSYLVIATYNKLSSYLKNVMNMNNLSREDQAKIDKQFDSIRKKLKDLEKFVVENPAIDSEEIIGIVEKINSSTSSRKFKYEVSVATPDEPVLDEYREALEQSADSLKQIYTWRDKGEVKLKAKEAKRLGQYSKQYREDIDGILASREPTQIEGLVDAFQKIYEQIHNRHEQFKR